MTVGGDEAPSRLWAGIGVDEKSGGGESSRGKGEDRGGGESKRGGGEEKKGEEMTGSDCWAMMVLSVMSVSASSSLSGGLLSSPLSGHMTLFVSDENESPRREKRERDGEKSERS